MRSIMKYVSGLSFFLVARAIEHINMPSATAEEYAEWLEALGFHATPHVAMATHSAGKRNWWLEQGRQLEEIPFFQDEVFSGGWYHFQETDVRFLEVVSATSGSRITALKSGISESWTLTLEVPAPCQAYDWGEYSRSFQEAVGDRKVVTQEGALEMDPITMETFRRDHSNLFLTEEEEAAHTAQRRAGGRARKRRPRPGEDWIRPQLEADIAE